MRSCTGAKGELDAEVQDFLERHEEWLAESMDAFALLQIVAAMTGKEITPALQAEVQAKAKDDVPWYVPAGIARGTLESARCWRHAVVKYRRVAELVRRPLVFRDLGAGIQKQ